MTRLRLHYGAHGRTLSVPGAYVVNVNELTAQEWDGARRSVIAALFPEKPEPPKRNRKANRRAR